MSYWLIFFEELKEVLAVCVFVERLGEAADLVGIDKVAAEGDFFGAGDFEALALLEAADAALRTGDFQRFGEALAELRDLLEGLSSAAVN